MRELRREGFVTRLGRSYLVRVQARALDAANIASHA